jgi:hypothetical protein
MALAHTFDRCNFTSRAANGAGRSHLHLSAVLCIAGQLENAGREHNYETRYAVTLAMLAGAAIESLRAQTKLPAYRVIEVNVKDPDLYKQYAEKALPLQVQYSARFIARGGKVAAFCR